MDLHFYTRISNGERKAMNKQPHKVQGHGGYQAYTTGFAISIVLTLAAFYFVHEKIFNGWELAIAILVLAVGQLLVQLLFFIHLGREEKPRWNLVSFLFMLLVILILAIGSLWIMYNLNYHNMVDNVDTRIMEEENIYR